VVRLRYQYRHRQQNDHCRPADAFLFRGFICAALTKAHAVWFCPEVAANDWVSIVKISLVKVDKYEKDSHREGDAALIFSFILVIKYTLTKKGQGLFKLIKEIPQL